MTAFSRKRPFPNAVHGSTAVAMGLGLLLMATTGSAEPLSLSISKAEATIDAATKAPILNLELTPDSKAAFGQWTSQLVGKQIIISIDGQPVISPIIREPILAGQMQITSASTLREWQELAKRLMAGRSKITADVKAD